MQQALNMVKFYVIIGHLLTGPQSQRLRPLTPLGDIGLQTSNTRPPETSNTPTPQVGVAHSVTTATQRIKFFSYNNNNTEPYDFTKNRSNNATEYITSRSIFRIPISGKAKDEKRQWRHSFFSFCSEK